MYITPGVSRYLETSYSTEREREPIRKNSLGEKQKIWEFQNENLDDTENPSSLKIKS